MMRTLATATLGVAYTVAAIGAASAILGARHQTGSLTASSLSRPVDGHLDAAIEIIEERATAGLKDDVGSVTVGIVVGDELVWTKSYGMADMDGEKPATRDTLYRIGSISKPFTAVMLAQLAERGVVNYFDPIEKHLPEFEVVENEWADSAAITLMQLATMRSGMSREPRNLRTHLVGAVSEWESVALIAMEETSVEFEPGTRYQYSNIGYAMLGLALGRAAKKPFVEYQLEEIIGPLGMKDTVFELDDRLRLRMSVGYAKGRGTSVNTDGPEREHAGRGYKVPNGAIYTTIDDLGKFVSMHFGHAPEGVISAETIESLHSGFTYTNGSLTSGYGIGLQTRRRGETVMLGHGGSVAGYTASMWFHPGSKVGVIALRNASGSSFNHGAMCIDALEEIVKSLDKDSERR